MSARVRTLVLAAALALASAAAAAPAAAVAPGTRHAQAPEAFGLAHASVRIETHDGAGLNGWWFEGAAGSPALVLAPRGRGTMADLLHVVAEFRRRGFSVLTFDYRDFGPGSSPHDTLAHVVFASRWVDDMVGALAHARALGGDTTHVFAWGQDLGSVVALAAAARDRRLCDGLAIEGVFRTTQEHLRANGTAVLPDVPERHRRIVLPADEPTSAAARLQVPLFVVLAGRDAVTPPEVTQMVVGRTLSRVDRWILPTAAREGAEATAGYYDRLARWFRSWRWTPPGGAPEES